ncbi:uncharacterized protein [Centruroides vittatus]|uniref:uncharacterized protein n=1 Tax=Centruroides vittatus TaxID=120091 RepID=UPI00350F862B
MGCASAKASRVTTTVAPVVAVCHRTQTENIVSRLEPPPVIIEGEKPPRINELTDTDNDKGTVSMHHPGNVVTRDDFVTIAKEVQLVAPSSDMNGSAVSITLTTEGIEDIREDQFAKTPVKVVVRESTEWMKRVTSVENEFRKLAERSVENPSEIFHYQQNIVNNSSSSSSSSNSIEDLVGIKQDIEMKPKEESIN